MEEGRAMRSVREKVTLHRRWDLTFGLNDEVDLLVPLHGLQRRRKAHRDRSVVDGELVSTLLARLQNFCAALHIDAVVHCTHKQSSTVRARAGKSASQKGRAAL